MRREARGAPWAALLVALPVGVGLAYTLAAAVGLAGAGAEGLSAAPLRAVVADGTTWRALVFSLWTAGAATALATVAAGTLALAFRDGGATDRAGRLLALLPLPVPHLVAASLGVTLLAQSGLVARLLHATGIVDAPADVPALVYDRAGLGLVLTMAWKECAFLAAVAFALMATRDRTLEETARTLGATRRDVAWRVWWPWLLRGMAPAIVAVFLFLVGSWESAVLLAPVDPPPLAVLTMERATDPDLGRRADAYVLALLAFAVAIVGVAVHERAQRAARRTGAAIGRGAPEATP